MSIIADDTIKRLIDSDVTLCVALALRSLSGDVYINKRDISHGALKWRVATERVRIGQ